MPDQTFGSVVTKGDVVAAVRDTLQTWAPTYCAWRARESGIAVPPPRHYITLRELDDWPKLQPPSVLIACTGLAETPSAHAGRSYLASWAVGVVAVVTGRDKRETDAVAEQMGAALRLLLIQKSALGGFAEGTDWLDEAYDALPEQDRRQLAGVRLEFAVETRDTASGRGPSAPADDPTIPASDVPIATDVTYTLNAEDMTDAE